MQVFSYSLIFTCKFFSCFMASKVLPFRLTSRLLPSTRVFSWGIPLKAFSSMSAILLLAKINFSNDKGFRNMTWEILVNALSERSKYFKNFSLSKALESTEVMELLRKLNSVMGISRNGWITLNRLLLKSNLNVGIVDFSQELPGQSSSAKSSVRFRRLQLMALGLFLSRHLQTVHTFDLVRGEITSDLPWCITGPEHLSETQKIAGLRRYF